MSMRKIHSYSRVLQLSEQPRSRKVCSDEVLRLITSASKFLTIASLDYLLGW